GLRGSALPILSAHLISQRINLLLPSACEQFSVDDKGEIRKKHHSPEGDRVLPWHDTWRDRESNHHEDEPRQGEPHAPGCCQHVVALAFQVPYIPGRTGSRFNG